MIQLRGGFLMVFSIPMKLVRLVKMFVHEACSDVLTGKYFSDEFQTASSLEQGEDLHPLQYKLFLRVCHEIGPSKP
jgi:hypothetical protein